MTLNVLLVDDDEEFLSLLGSTLPGEIAGESIRWEPCLGFDAALQLIEERRYDVVVTDIYRDQEGVQKGAPASEPRGTELLEEIRSRRFSPVLFITSGPFPAEPARGPFVKFADKSENGAIEREMAELLATGVPALAHAIHDELDRTSASYLWSFLDGNWEAMEAGGLTQPEVLDRLIHRRASVQLGRLDDADGQASERPTVEGAEFYLTPRIASGFRLGEIVRREDEYRVVLTPHCHLVVQPDQDVPRADFVLTALALPWGEVFDKDALKGGSEDTRFKNLRRRLQSPADDLGRPSGRYWFLPGLLDMDHRFVDFMQIGSIPIKELSEEWTPFAVLDMPFAEAMQSCFVHFYSAVGLPSLDARRFGDMIAERPSDT